MNKAIYAIQPDTRISSAQRCTKSLTSRNRRQLRLASQRPLANPIRTAESCGCRMIHKRTKDPQQQEFLQSEITGSAADHAPPHTPPPRCVRRLGAPPLSAGASPVGCGWRRGSYRV